MKALTGFNIGGDYYITFLNINKFLDQRSFSKKVIDIGEIDFQTKCVSIQPTHPDYHKRNLSCWQSIRKNILPAKTLFSKYGGRQLRAWTHRRRTHHLTEKKTGRTGKNISQIVPGTAIVNLLNVNTKTISNLEIPFLNRSCSFILSLYSPPLRSFTPFSNKTGEKSLQNGDFAHHAGRLFRHHRPLRSNNIIW